MKLKSAYYEIKTSKRILLFCVSLLLGIPIDLFQVGDKSSGFPISLIVIAIAMFLPIMSWSKESFYLKISFFLSILSILMAMLFVYQISVRPFASVLYFFAPLSCYFLAKKLIYSKKEFHYFIECTSVVAVVLAISLFVSIFILGDGTVRTEGVLNGTFCGLSLSGAYGVHSLAAHYFILLFFILFALMQNDSIGAVKRICYILAAILFSYILVMSLSREIVVALLGLLITFIYFAYGPLRSVCIYAIICLLFISLYNLFSVYIWDMWSTKINATFYASSIDELSSGRLPLQNIALEQLKSNPLFGTGFYGYGYQVDYNAYGDLDDLIGWSPHNYFLTVVWKMGLVASIFYFIFWIRALFQAKRKLMFFSKKSSVLVTHFIFWFLFVVNMLWDALLVPNVMAIFSFFIGALAAYWYEPQRLHKI